MKIRACNFRDLFIIKCSLTFTFFPICLIRSFVRYWVPNFWWVIVRAANGTHRQLHRERHSRKSRVYFYAVSRCNGIKSYEIKLIGSANCHGLLHFHCQHSTISQWYRNDIDSIIGNRFNNGIWHFLLVSYSWKRLKYISYYSNDSAFVPKTVSYSLFQKRTCTNFWLYSILVVEAATVHRFPFQLATPLTSTRMLQTLIHFWCNKHFILSYKLDYFKSLCIYISTGTLKRASGFQSTVSAVISKFPVSFIYHDHLISKTTET